MESPRPADVAGRGGGGAAWRRDHRPHSATALPVPHTPRRPGALRDLLTAAAEARRIGDHGAADLLEADAAVLLRSLLSPELAGAEVQP